MATATKTPDQRRAEIEQEGTGLAILVGVDLANPDNARPMYQAVREASGTGRVNPDPYDAALRLKDSIADDFPTYGFSIVVNERARYLRWLAQMEIILGAGHGSIETYLEVK